ncbi:MAG: flagellar filament capping protein FliD [bacterium]
MTEINTTRLDRPFRRDTEARNGPTNAEANSISGLASGLNTKQIMDTIMQVEKNRLRPIESRKSDTQVELDAYNLVKEALDTLQTDSDALAEAGIWEGKLVKSSNDDVVTALGTAGAKPGKHTLVVDRLALNHQISSQGYEKPDVEIGSGSFKILIGEESSFTVVLDDSNNTVTGLKDAINRASTDVNATVIKTGAKEKSYQLVLTSQKTGSDGRISLESDLRGGETPNFENSVEFPSDWKGVGPAPKPKREVVTGVGASTVIVRVISEYTGEEDRTFNFTAVQTGIVGGDTTLQMRWEDSTGRSGVLELDTFNYAPGEPLDFVDGLSLVFSQGEIIVGDQFSFITEAKVPDGYFWIESQNRAAKYTQPTPWQRQATFGAPVIEGAFGGTEELNYKLTVLGSGQIGSAKDLAIRWETEAGDTGVVRVGQGYVPGTQLALNKGLTMTIQPGVLNDKSVSTFRAVPAHASGKWWLGEEARRIPPSIEDVTNFKGLEQVDSDGEPKFDVQPELPEALGPRVSSTLPSISGEYTGDDSRVYTFTASRDGAVGTTKGLALNWVDDKGNSGELKMGDGYTVDLPLAFDSGLSLALGGGRVFEGDSFSLRTHTSTIQPAQDALIRFGATELGGGLEITNTTNEFDSVIEGVKLTLVTTSEKPVTITIKGDTEKASETVLRFAENYNQTILLINELTKFDPENNSVGPLLGDRDLVQIRNDLTTRMMDPVPGLPQSLNMLAALGLKLDHEGALTIDESVLNEKIDDDFSGVANVFRNRGESSNSGITFLNMSADTRANPAGYDVDIERVATRGHYLSPALAQPVAIAEGSQAFFITVNGVQSQVISLTPGPISPAELVTVLQNAITNDENVGSFRVRVMLEDNKIKVTSGRFGSRSTVGFSPTTINGEVPPGLSGGDSVTGTDVTGTIGAEPAEGIGQLLRGGDDSRVVKGLRLLVTLTENQVDENGAEGKVIITKGVGSRVAQHLKGFLDPRGGNMQRITGNLREQLKNLESQLSLMNERMDNKRQRLRAKFARLESQMSTLKSQQNFMTSQISGLPGGGGGGLPGL